MLNKKTQPSNFYQQVSISITDLSIKRVTTAFSLEERNDGSAFVVSPEGSYEIPSGSWDFWPPRTQ